MPYHLAALAAAHPHVSDLRYATETWTPGGTVLAVIILAVLVFVWLKIPSGPKVTVRRPAPAKTRAAVRAGVSSRR